MRVIIAGGREFSDYNTLKRKCDYYLQNIKEPVEVISGHASGADALGERYANEKGYKITMFPADWKRYGKSAGPIRNRQMAEYADVLIAFWDGISLGTKNMIDQAKEKGLKIKIVKY